MFTRPAITPPEVNGFRWNLGHFEYIVCSWPDRFWTWSTQKQQRESEPKFCFFCQVNARLYRFPVLCHHKSFWITFLKICTQGGFFPKRQLLRENLHATSDLRPRFLRNDYKSRKVTTGWHAYGMLTFHLYRWNQLTVILLACRLRKRNDIPGHRWLFHLALQT